MRGSTRLFLGASTGGGMDPRYAQAGRRKSTPSTPTATTPAAITPNPNSSSFFGGGSTYVPPGVIPGVTQLPSAQVPTIGTPTPTTVPLVCGGAYRVNAAGNQCELIPSTTTTPDPAPSTPDPIDDVPAADSGSGSSSTPVYGQASYFAGYDTYGRPVDQYGNAMNPTGPSSYQSYDPGYAPVPAPTDDEVPMILPERGMSRRSKVEIGIGGALVLAGVLWAILRRKKKHA